jgi:hypothetical protein
MYSRWVAGDPSINKKNEKKNKKGKRGKQGRRTADTRTCTCEIYQIIARGGDTGHMWTGGRGTGAAREPPRNLDGKNSGSIA